MVFVNAYLTALYQGLYRHGYSKVAVRVLDKFCLSFLWSLAWNYKGTKAACESEKVRKSATSCEHTVVIMFWLPGFTSLWTAFTSCCVTVNKQERYFKDV